jgi:hypothetical protein
MHDDMFGPVQAMQEALDDFSTVSDGEPRLLLYPMFQYVIFYLCELLHIFDPQSKMLVVRLFHAFYSLLVVYFGYKITLLISNEKLAKQVGIILAFIWFLPYMSVRNLVEVASIPPMLAGVYFVLRSKEKDYGDVLLAGLFFAFAFIMRVQTAFIPIGMAAVLLLQQRFRMFAVLTFALLAISAFIIGLQDYCIWEKPFESVISYISYNSTAYNDYPNAPWYTTYILVIGVLIPPLGVMLFYGFLRTWRQYAILFVPVFLFLLFHAIYPNKQERFILTIMPLLIILGICGWNYVVEKSGWWMRHKKLLKGNWIWFWFINTLLLVLFVGSYSKRTRVESFTYLSDKQVSGIVIDIGTDGSYFPPLFYLGRNSGTSIEIINVETDEIANVGNTNYAIIFDESDLDARKDRISKEFGTNLQLVQTLEPGLIDKVLHFTNPRHNKNYTAYIYKIEK